MSAVCVGPYIVFALDQKQQATCTDDIHLSKQVDTGRLFVLAMLPKFGLPYFHCAKGGHVFEGHQLRRCPIFSPKIQ